MDMTKFDKRCIELLNDSPNRFSRSCLRSALNHIDRAEALLEIDREMCIFRCLTAEEEAASALMHCLKERGYVNAELLKPKDHVFKNAILPFLSFVGTFFHETISEQGIKPILHLADEEGVRRFVIRIPMTINGESMFATPIPPLNFGVTSEEQLVSFKKQIDAHVEKTGSKDIVSHIRELANFRNTLLYAGPEGYLKVEDLKVEYIERYHKRVLIFIRAYLLIFPYKPQPFVQHALNAFLAMMGKLDNHDLHNGV